MSVPDRHSISSSHALVGTGYRLLTDYEDVTRGDETACLSSLRSINAHEGWRPVSSEFIGKTVKENCDESGDVDGYERLFRQPVQPVRAPVITVLIFMDTTACDPRSVEVMTQVPAIGDVVIIEDEHYKVTDKWWFFRDTTTVYLFLNRQKQ